MEQNPSHTESLVALKRIEGQVRGIQKMIDRNEYCVDIVNQVHAAISALARVEDGILERHFQHCVANAIHSRSAADKKKKLEEILELLSRFRKA